MVLSHGNLVRALLCLLPTACAAMDITAAAAEDDCYIALLPLAHVLELLAEHVMLVRAGNEPSRSFTVPGEGPDCSILRLFH